MAIAALIARIALWLVLAPLLPGIINKVKAWVAGRRGPPVLQLYYDLARLWRKRVVMSVLASPAFIVGPAVAWVAVAVATLMVPLGPAGATLSFRGDVILMLYLLALARFATAWAAMETGSAFEGMGAAREVSYAVLAEAAMIAAMLTLSVQTGSVSLSTMLAPSVGTSAVLLAVGLFTVLLAENCRVPFDDPATHLDAHPKARSSVDGKDGAGALLQRMVRLVGSEDRTARRRRGAGTHRPHPARSHRSDAGTAMQRGAAVTGVLTD